MSSKVITRFRRFATYGLGACLAFSMANLSVAKIYLSGRGENRRMGLVGGLVLPMIGLMADI